MFRRQSQVRSPRMCHQRRRACYHPACPVKAANQAPVHHQRRVLNRLYRQCQARARHHPACPVKVVNQALVHHRVHRLGQVKLRAVFRPACPAQYHRLDQALSPLNRRCRVKSPRLCQAIFPAHYHHRYRAPYQAFNRPQVQVGVLDPASRPQLCRVSRPRLCRATFLLACPASRHHRNPVRAPCQACLPRRCPPFYQAMLRLFCHLPR